MTETLDLAPTTPGPRVTITVRRDLSATGPSGEDLTPRSQKSQALLALLALSPEHRRTRRWVEERLWSDRSPQQSAGSLRQCLVDVRKALGPFAEVLQADRRWIGLDPARIVVDGAAGEGEDFLDGLPIRDRAFRDWLASLRPVAPSPPRAAAEAAEPPAPAAETPLTIRWGTASPPGSRSGLVAGIIASRIAEGISDHVPTWQVAADPPPERAGLVPDLDVACEVIEDNGICLAFVRVMHVQSGRVLYSRDLRLTGTATSLVESAAVAEVAFEAAEIAVGQIPHVVARNRTLRRSTALGQLALHKMFSFDRAQMDEADKLLAEAFEVEENSVFLAWRGLLQMVKSIELSQKQSPELREMADALTAYAMERSRHNPTVAGLVAHTRGMMFRDVGTSASTAGQALGRDPRNPFAMQAMAVARMLAGDDEDAYQLSARARAFASRSTFRHWWDAHHFVSCVATGRLDEGIASAEAVLQASPSFRPAYRFLIPLYASKDDLARAAGAAEKLARIEPGFTLLRMIEDPAYPVATLRRTGLLGQARKLL